MWLPLVCPLLGNWPATQACALDWELNQQELGSQAGVKSTEPHQPGMSVGFLREREREREREKEKY